MIEGNKAHNSRLIASVAVDRTLYPYDYLYDYYVPTEYESLIKPGMTVTVPFGRGNRKHIAMVFSLHEKELVEEQIKPVLSVITDCIVLSREMLELAAWLKENTFCTYFDGIRTILPAGLSFNITAKYEFNRRCEGVLSETERQLFDQCAAAKSSRELDFILESHGGEKNAVVKALIEKGCIKKSESAKRRIGDETEKMVRLAADFESNDRFAQLSVKQKSVVNALSEVVSASVKELCYLCNITPVVIKNLVRYGILEEFELEVSRSVTALAEASSRAEDILFSEAQQRVYDGILELMNDENPRCALLYGVTGSGKTSVFIKLINEALSQGKTALMLVPEISLTPQMVGNFQQIFGNKVAIIHSNLSMGQRTDEYKRISSGEARIVIGTRSAVFAPLDNIGIIVIDEEGEHTYKSEKAPRYHHSVAYKAPQYSVHKTLCAFGSKLHRFAYCCIFRNAVHIKKLIQTHSQKLQNAYVYFIKFY